MERFSDCIFCFPEKDPHQEIALENEHCRFLMRPEEVLVGSGIIVPKLHRETLFDLTEREWRAIFPLLQQVRSLLESKFQPQGYNVGWNIGQVAGQEIFHAHLHVIPRFSDEPLAGKGIRYWLKQPRNRRTREEGRS